MKRLIGYARVSTEDQNAGLAAQIRDLKAIGCHRIFSEQVSSVAERAQLALALAEVGPGDALAVTKPDRLARSTMALLGIEADLSARGIGLVVLSMGGERLDTRNPTSKLMLTILAGVATWEREIMLERQREGVARAKLAGKYKGSKPRPSPAIDSVIRQRQNGVPPDAIAQACGISRRTVFRIIKAHNPTGIGHFPHDPGAARDTFEQSPDIAA